MIHKISEQAELFTPLPLFPLKKPLQKQTTPLPSPPRKKKNPVKKPTQNNNNNTQILQNANKQEKP